MSKKESDEISEVFKKGSYDYEKGVLRGVFLGLSFAAMIALLMYTTQPLP
jgi:hypothetical protein